MDKVNYPRFCNSEVWSSLDGVKWKQELKEAPWEIRHTFGCVVYKDRMWVIGGDIIQGHYQPDVWSSHDGVNWDLVAGKTPWGNRALHHTLVFNDKLWVIGGQTHPGFVPSIEYTCFYNDVWNSKDGKNWNQVTNHAPWAPRGMIGGFAVLNNRMWILGGGTYDTPKYPYRLMYNDIWSSADGVNWEYHTKNAGWPLRQYHEVAAFDGHLWVLEGYGSDSAANNRFYTEDFSKYLGNRNDVWYSSDGVNWSQLKGTPWKPRHAVGVCVHNDSLWLIAGNNFDSDVWKLARDL